MSKSHAAPDSLSSAVLAAGIPSGARLLVAVSGGPDSVALLDILGQLAADEEWSLAVGHVNHCLRGEESDRDEQFVRTLARDRSLPIFAKSVDTRKHALGSRLSIESAARELRHSALSWMLESWPGDFIVTGHTQDDQAETILLHLLRGAGLDGLGGMRRLSGHLLRPFLGIRHDTILRYLKAHGLTYRLDSSNRDTRHARNRLRSQIIPHLQAVQPRTIEVLSRTAELLQADSDFILREAQRAVALLDVEESDEELSASVGAWRALHPSLRGHTLRLLLQRLRGGLADIDEAHFVTICQTIDGASGDVALTGRLPGGVAVFVNGPRFTLRCGLQQDAAPLGAIPLGVPGSVDTVVGRLSAQLNAMMEWGDFERLIAVCGPSHALCDADAAGSILTVRSRRPGDRMRPLGAPGSRKVQDIMVDRAVPTSERQRVPVVDNGRHIVWLGGIALDQRVAVTPATKRILHLRFEPRRWERVLEYAGI